MSGRTVPLYNRLHVATPDTAAGIDEENKRKFLVRTVDCFERAIARVSTMGKSDPKQGATVVEGVIAKSTHGEAVQRLGARLVPDNTRACNAHVCTAKHPD